MILAIAGENRAIIQEKFLNLILVDQSHSLVGL